jgi:hypothetical protein
MGQVPALFGADLAESNHRACAVPPDVTGSHMRGITEPRERAPEPIMKDGFVHYHIQCVEDDRPVRPEVVEVELARSCDFAHESEGELMRRAIPQLTIRNFSGVQRAGLRDFDGSAGCHIRGRMRLDEQRKQRNHDSGSKTREEECSLHLAEVKHGYSRTNKYKKKIAAQKGTANASQTATYKLIRSAESAMTHHSMTGRTLIHFIKSRFTSTELTSPIKV